MCRQPKSGVMALVMMPKGMDFSVLFFCLAVSKGI